MKTPSRCHPTLAVIGRLTATIAVGLLAVAASRCGGAGAAYTPEEASRARTTLETVQVREVVKGTGERAEPGRRLVVHYTGWLYDSAAADHRGSSFDSSRTAGRPYDFVLGGGQVIPGWERGLAGLAEGGTRELTIPARLGYGAEGSAPRIPPDATLVFEVELIEVR
jgi:FKBP-type peptidyl-prolyl cis-trans isomerase FkpA